MSDIFISYSRTIEPQARQVAETLRADPRFIAMLAAAEARLAASGDAE